MKTCISQIVKQLPLLTICMGVAIAQWISLWLPSCCPGFESQAPRLRFLQFIELYNVEKTKINKKRPGLAHFKKTNYFHFNSNFTFDVFPCELARPSGNIFGWTSHTITLFWNPHHNNFVLKPPQHNNFKNHTFLASFYSHLYFFSKRQIYCTICNDCNLRQNGHVQILRLLNKSRHYYRERKSEMGWKLSKTIY